MDFRLQAGAQNKGLLFKRLHDFFASQSVLLVRP
jgi:hypothetical protein